MHILKQLFHVEQFVQFHQSQPHNPDHPLYNTVLTQPVFPSNSTRLDLTLSKEAIFYRVK